MIAVDVRQYRVEARGAAFVAVAEPPLPNGVKEAERPSYELARAVARLWRIEHGGKIQEGERTGKCAGTKATRP